MPDIALTLEEIIVIEPRVADLIEKCKTLPDGICGQRAWYKDEFKGTLVRIVGRGCATPALQTPHAYSTVYDACLKELPKCGYGRCYSCGRPLPDNLSFKGSYPAKEEFQSVSAVPSWIAVLDMLGYSNTVIDAEKSASTDVVLNDLRRIVAETYPFLGGGPANSFSEESTDWRFKAYADNVLVYVPTAEMPFSRLHWLCSALAQFQMAMVLHGQLIRGGLTAGLNYVDKDIAFGGGLIEAHIIEQHLASSPRVVIAPRTRRFEAYLLQREDSQNLGLSSFFMIDADGEWFLDYLALFNGRSEEPFDPNALSRHRETVSDMHKKYGDIPKLSSKYDWLIRYHDASCASAGRKDVLLHKDHPGEFPRLLNNDDIRKEAEAYLSLVNSAYGDDEIVFNSVLDTVAPLLKEDITKEAC